MNTRNRLILSATFLLTLSLAGLAGCGGDDLECGERTIAEDGSCVPNTSEIRSCGENTEVNAEGECVLATGGCGPNAAFDSERGRCIPTSDSCSEGTEFDGESGTCVGVTGCGENTVQNDDGTCVPDVGTLCADQPGVQYDPDSGNCTVAAASCGPGTQLSAQSGTCVISDAACDQGLTINDDGNCVPTDQVCGEQSTLAEVDGSQICVPSATCQENDVVLMPAQSGQGVCVEPAEALANNPDRTESEESDNSSGGNNDVDNGGEADSIPTKSVGETTAVTGTIGPPVDVDGDDELEQDQDTFTFEGQTGQWFSVSLQSLGLPHGWFQVFGPNGFEREAQLGLQGNPARQIVLPYDGEYEIEVMTAENAFDTNGDVGPAGDPSWGYVLGLEQLDTPDPTGVDFSSNTASGDLPTVTDNLYRLNGFSDGDLIELSAASLGGGAQGAAVVSVWTDPSTPILLREVSGGDSVVFQYQTNSNGNGPLVHIDWKFAVTPDLGYELSAGITTDIENLGTLKPGGTLTSTPRTLEDDPAETYNYFVNIPGETVMRLTHINDDDEEGEFSIRELGGNEIGFLNFYDSRNDSFFDPDEGYVYIDQPMTLLISATPEGTFFGDADLTNLELRLESKSVNSTVSGLQAGDRLLEEFDSSASADGTDWHTFSVSDAAQVAGVVEKLQPSGSNPDFTVRLYPKTSGILENEFFEVDSNGSTADLTSNLGFAESVVLPALGTEYLISVQMDDPPLDRYEIDWNFNQVPVEQEPNDTPATATSLPLGENLAGVALDPGANPFHVDHYSINLDTDLGSQEVVEFELVGANNETNQWRCDVLDGSGNELVPYVRNESDGDGGDQGCVIILSNTTAGSTVNAGTYYLRLEYDDSNTNIYVTSATRRAGVYEEEPNDTAADAESISLSDFSSGVALYGNGVINLDQDDTDRWEITTSSSSISQFEVTCDSIGPDPGDLEYRLLDQADNELDADTDDEPVTLSSGSVSPSDAPFTVEVITDDFSPEFADNQYRCEYQTP